MRTAMLPTPRDQVGTAVPVPVEADAGSLMAVIERAARDPSVDAGKMERLLGMFNALEARQAEREFNIALSAAQGEVGPIATDASNPNTKSKYASYLALDRVLRPIYTKHGLCPSFDTTDSQKPDHVKVLCYLTHSGGHSRTYSCDMPADGKGAKGGDVMTRTHATGSAMSYGQRYLLKLIFNIAVGGDDDGNAAARSGDKITEAQAVELRNLLQANGADISKFCAYFRIGAVPDLPAKDYQRASAMTRRKGAQR